MLRAALLAFAVVLAGCASTGPGPGSGTTGPRAPGGWPGQPSAPARPAVSPMLEQEHRWLGQWFNGTPVVVGAGQDGALAVDVPLEFSFDAGKSVVKPPLAAVLDKLAESLARQHTARVQVSAPADGARAEVLARERAERVRDYLQKKGVQPRRIEPVPFVGGSAVALRVSPPPPGLERLEDAPPGAGRRITPAPKPRPAR